MNRSSIVVALAMLLAAGPAADAHAGAPEPDQRQDDFVHVCRGGINKGDACTLETEAQDCPKSDCILKVVSAPISGTLTVIAHDSVTDWRTGAAGNRATTVMLELRAPDRSKQMLAATYQNLIVPTDPPEAPGHIVAIPLDEQAVSFAATGVGGLLFAQPEPTLAEHLKALFASEGTPVIVAAEGRRAELADHRGDGLATVLRFKIKLQFVEPAA